MTLFAQAAEILNKKTSNTVKCLMIVSLLLIALGGWSVYVTLRDGIGAWGLNNPVPWGLDITCFVFWIGVAHAGTLLSAVLLVFGQQWRNSIHRAAEAMTIVSLVCAAFFPLIHTGRPWFAFYWLLPYPNQMGLLPNFRSPILWDIFAIIVYFVVSILFFYYGLIPDLRPTSYFLKSKYLKKLYVFLSAGWIGSVRQWALYHKFYIIAAGMITALVVSVHSIVSYDFAVTIVPGWHSTIFPVYFVCGAIFSGVALVAILLVFVRREFDVSQLITLNHIDKLNKIVLATSLILIFLIFEDFRSTLTNAGSIEQFIAMEKLYGRYCILFWTMIFLTVLMPQLYWFRKLRHTTYITVIVSFCVCAGMWLERFLIVVPSMEKGYFSSTWSNYIPNFTELTIFTGSIGLFVLLYLLIFRIFPIFSANEIETEHHATQNEA